jgi:hypothetical protein
LCMTVAEALEFHRVSRRFQFRKCRLLRLPGDLGRSTNRPKRHFLVCPQQKQQSLQCRLVSMARSPHRPRQLWLCRLQIGRPRIPVYQQSVLGLRFTVHSKEKPTVSTWPGSTSITRILVAINSLLKLSVNILTAALVAQ